MTIAHPIRDEVHVRFVGRSVFAALIATSLPSLLPLASAAKGLASSSETGLPKGLPRVLEGDD
jgi:hypothetical protein